MSELAQKYPKSIAAGRAIEGGVWALALSLAEEVKTNRGTTKEACEALAEAGVTSTSGTPYSERRVQVFVRVGTTAVDGDGEFQHYPFERVSDALQRHDDDVEAALLTLKAGGTLHEIRGTSPLGTATRDKVRAELERLSAEDRAALATDLVSQTEVREAILRSDPLAREQHLTLGGSIVRESEDRSERHMKESHPSHAASDAANEVSIAANHLNNALAEVIQWGVGVEHDRLNRLSSAMTRAERAVDEINEAIGRTATV